MNLGRKSVEKNQALLKWQVEEEVARDDHDEREEESSYCCGRKG